MRYINIADLQVPPGWLTRAQALEQDLQNAADDDARKEIIDNNEIWRELLVPLSNLSNGKCWYSEAKELMSDRDVDHFRPKKEARNVDDIPRASNDGYWWLAFDWENYRFSSIYSNRRRQDKFVDEDKTGGKWSYFPLFEHSPVATTKPRCADEDIMLLDPCDRDDPGLLTFDSSGTAIPNTGAINNAKEKRRVLTSVRLYHLDHEPLREEREKVWDRCQRLINEIRNITLQADISISDKTHIRFLKGEIRKMVHRDQELSAVAIACCEDNGLSYLTGQV